VVREAAPAPPAPTISLRSVAREVVSAPPARSKFPTYDPDQHYCECHPDMECDAATDSLAIGSTLRTGRDVMSALPAERGFNRTSEPEHSASSATPANTHPVSSHTPFHAHNRFSTLEYPPPPGNLRTPWPTNPASWTPTSAPLSTFRAMEPQAHFSVAGPHGFTIEEANGSLKQVTAPLLSNPAPEGISSWLDELDIYYSAKGGHRHPFDLFQPVNTDSMAALWADLAARNSHLPAFSAMRYIPIPQAMEWLRYFYKCIADIDSHDSRSTCTFRADSIRHDITALQTYVVNVKTYQLKLQLADETISRCLIEGLLPGYPHLYSACRTRAKTQGYTFVNLCDYINSQGIAYRTALHWIDSLDAGISPSTQYRKRAHPHPHGNSSHRKFNNRSREREQVTTTATAATTPVAPAITPATPQSTPKSMAAGRHPTGRPMPSHNNSSNQSAQSTTAKDSKPNIEQYRKSNNGRDRAARNPGTGKQ